MTKQEKATAILTAPGEGFSVYAKLPNGNKAQIEGVAFDGDRIFGFSKSADSDAIYTRLDVTELEVFKYYNELICGATKESVAEQGI